MLRRDGKVRRSIVVIVSSSIGDEIGRFGAVDGVEKVIVKNVSGGVGGRVVVAVIFRVVDGLIGTPFDDEAALLDGGLVIFDSQRCDAGNGRIRDGELGPLVSGDFGAGGKGQEMIVALRIPGRIEGNGTE